ncbi:MAG: ImmA/IrrE family metallo-endopeptidase [Chloroflexi bacterium]|nr:ImmA/IrrE family metallo-endopeptidase [Chloroflexota bacterium]
MNRARRRADTLRRELGLRGRVDAVAVANALGLEVWPWQFEVQKEMQIDGQIAVAKRLGPEWRRWVIAHAIAHRLLHPGNHIERRDHTDLPLPWEREAEDFAHALLIDEEEALAEGFVYAWEVAEHFGVPVEVVRVQARLPENGGVS